MTTIQNRCHKHYPVSNDKPSFYRLSGGHDIKNITAFLLERRKALKLSEIDLDITSGVSYRAISYWRNGRDPKMSSFIFFAEALGYELLLCKKDQLQDNQPT